MVTFTFLLEYTQKATLIKVFFTDYDCYLSILCAVWLLRKQMKENETKSKF